MRGTPWGFAHRIEPLALLDDAVYGVFNWVYSYQYPDDCLFINRLILNYEAFSSTSGAVRPRHIEDIYHPDLEARVPHTMVVVSNKKVIASNDPELRVSYRSRITDPNFFDEVFIQALVYLLASELAVPIVGGETGRALRQENFAIYQTYINNASALNNNEVSFSPPRDSDFITARR